jgi:hypothetical protein
MNTDEIRGYCACCGSALKYPVEFTNGKQYGWRCAEALLGTKLIVRADGKLDAEAMADREAKREAVRAGLIRERELRETVSRPRLQQLSTSPVTLALLKSFKKYYPEYASWQRSSDSFRASLLRQLFTNGSLSPKQLAALSKSLRLQLSEADQILSQRPEYWDSFEGHQQLEQLFRDHNAGLIRYYYELTRQQD